MVMIYLHPAFMVMRLICAGPFAWDDLQAAAASLISVIWIFSRKICEAEFPVHIDSKRRGSAYFCIPAVQ
jgi:hypothetical protein